MANIRHLEALAEKPVVKNGTAGSSGGHWYQRIGRVAPLVSCHQYKMRSRLVDEGEPGRGPTSRFLAMTGEYQLHTVSEMYA